MRQYCHCFDEGLGVCQQTDGVVEQSAIGSSYGIAAVRGVPNFGIGRTRYDRHILSTGIISSRRSKDQRTDVAADHIIATDNFRAAESSFDCDGPNCLGGVQNKTGIGVQYAVRIAGTRFAAVQSVPDRCSRSSGIDGNRNRHIMLSGHRANIWIGYCGNHRIADLSR